MRCYFSPKGRRFGGGVVAAGWVTEEVKRHSALGELENQFIMLAGLEELQFPNS